MPRIDPEQLLNCLQVLLNPSGGILSVDEVLRLANLMTKFSKKLVSKCIYVLILKNTERTLLGSFMTEGGWNLIHLWIQDAHSNKNWALVIEILELLLITPVDVERLKMNNLPKLVKSLTKRDDLPGVQDLASNLVEEWLKIVKDVTKAEAKEREAIEAAQKICADPLSMEEDDDNNSGLVEEVVENDITGTNLNLENRRQMDNQENVEPVSKNVETVSTEVKTETSNDNHDTEDKKDKKAKLDDKNKHRSSSSSRSSKDKSKSKHSSSSSSSSKSSRDKDKKDKDRHRSSSSSSGTSSKHKSGRSSSTSSTRDKDKSRDKEREKKESKEKQSEKDKDTLAKILPPTIDKLGRIPKKSDSDKNKSVKKEEVKKPTFSVEVRKTDEKPKTVKIFNSKMRSTGLLEEAKPPPPRSSTKKTVVATPIVSVKRSSPIRDAIPPPEKKSRLLEAPIIRERAGSTKFTAAKPKPAILLESDIFMDALTASATSKKEPKKRKRKPSVTKEPSPPPADNPSSPSGLKTITSGANFYQDTLKSENEPGNESMEEDNKSTGNEEDAGSNEENQEEGPEVDTVKTDSNGLRGVLSYSKRRGPKKTIKWKPEADLVEIQYFELDETERVNVMKTFGDMAKLEMSGEREALRSRKLINEDVMELQTPWRALIELDLPPTPNPVVISGAKSLEKEIQFAREKRVLPTIYFNNRIPDAPGDPDPETHPITDPIVIPLEDPDSPDGESQLQPWPEPKGSPPHIPSTPPVCLVPPFIALGVPPGGFPPTGIPPFAPPGFMPPMMRPPGPGEWNGIPNGLPPRMPPPQEIINQGPPPIFDSFVPHNIPDNGFQPPFNNQINNVPPFPPNNFNNNNIRGRGGPRRGGGGPWIRMGGPAQKQGSWNNNRGGGGHNRGNNRFCHNVKKFGFCRHRDNCPFMHPN